jgi:hypothetical protein
MSPCTVAPAPILSVQTIGTYGVAVSRWRRDDPPPAGHHIESVRAGEYWLVRDDTPAAVCTVKGHLV